MTKTLTEQWRDGTLPEDCYYILTKNGHIRSDRTCFYSHTDEQCFCFTSNKDIKEVLTAVPRYDEYKRLVSNSDELENQNILLNSYKKENKRLNAVLKHIEKLAGEYVDELVDVKRKAERLEKRLAIATKALKGICVWANTGNGGEQAVKKVCENALKEMEGVK